MTKFAALALLSACFLFPVYSYGQTPSSTVTSNKPRPNATQNDRKSEDDKRGTDGSPVVVKILPPSDLQITTKKSADEHHDYSSAEWWLVYVTGGLAAFTLGLMIFTLKLWGATKKLVTETQTAESPYLIPVFEDLENTPTDRPSPKVRYAFMNGGKTPASITRFQDILRFIGDLPENPDVSFGDQWDNRKEEYFPVGPGTRCAETFTCHLHQADAANLKDTQRSFYLIGRVEYIDLPGRRRDQRFCWKIKGSKVWRAGGIRYNYDHPQKKKAWYAFLCPN